MTDCGPKSVIFPTLAAIFVLHGEAQLPWRLLAIAKSVAEELERTLDELEHHTVG